MKRFLSSILSYLSTLLNCLPFTAISVAQSRESANGFGTAYESGDKPQLLTISYFVMQDCSRTMQMFTHVLDIFMK